MGWPHDFISRLPPRHPDPRQVALLARPVTRSSHTGPTHGSRVVAAQPAGTRGQDDEEEGERPRMPGIVGWSLVPTVDKKKKGRGEGGGGERPKALQLRWHSVSTTLNLGRRGWGWRASKRAFRQLRQGHHAAKPGRGVVRSRQTWLLITGYHYAGDRMGRDMGARARRVCLPKLSGHAARDATH